MTGGVIMSGVWVLVMVLLLVVVVVVQSHLLHLRVREEHQLYYLLCSKDKDCQLSKYAMLFEILYVHYLDSGDDICLT